MIAAGLVAVRARKRYTGVVLVSVTGLGMVLLFATSGAPDLALTQILVETVTLVAFALVLRRIPSRMGEHNASVGRSPRAVLGVGVGVTMALVAIVATGARVGDADLGALPRRSPTSSATARTSSTSRSSTSAAGTRWASSRCSSSPRRVSHPSSSSPHRADTLSRLTTPLPPSRQRARAARSSRPPRACGRATAATGQQPQAWLVGGQRVRPENRSIILEVIVRILFHTIIVVSLYLLFAGHNLPGGGFAGGLVAGMALVMRYIAGGRYELGAAAPTDAGRLLGAGHVASPSACAIVPLFFGARAADERLLRGGDPRSSATWSSSPRPSSTSACTSS